MCANILTLIFIYFIYWYYITLLYESGYGIICVNSIILKKSGYKFGIKEYNVYLCHMKSEDKGEILATVVIVTVLYVILRNTLGAKDISQEVGLILLTPMLTVLLVSIYYLIKRL